MRNASLTCSGRREAPTPCATAPLATGTDDNGDDAGPKGSLAAATARIRSFCRNDRLLLTYLSTSDDPYRSDGAQIDIYADTHGYEYWIDAANGILVQAGPGPGGDPPPRTTGSNRRLSVPALRSEAVSIATENIPGFAEKKNGLHPLEDNRRGEVYFFRWDDFTRPLAESELPPFVQVALYADGAIAGYTDTLSR